MSGNGGNPNEAPHGEHGACARDYRSGQEVRWCPGCGDHAILSHLLKLLPKLGVPREKFVFVSGIGCSSRFPYYMETYGIHGIHGRAPAIATGLKCAKPDLSVWVITGDGDGLSIGTNHLIHSLRRNMDIKILLFNNRIYGLTKGQYSPTSEYGKKTKSSPHGTIEQPINPVQMALASQTTFAARTIFSSGNHMAPILEAAARHRGSAFIEILQNCLVFNPRAFDHLNAPDTRDDARILLEHDKPVRFGKDGCKGLVMSPRGPEIVSIDENGVREKDLVVHDTQSPSPLVARMLAALAPPEFPIALGIFRAVERPTYSDLLLKQIADAQDGKGQPSLAELFSEGTTWDVTGTV